MFCTGNTNKGSNEDEDKIDINNCLGKENLVQNKNLKNQKDLNIKSINLDIGEFLENKFIEAYKKNKLVQTIINAKVKKL